VKKKTKKPKTLAVGWMCINKEHKGGDTVITRLKRKDWIDVDCKLIKVRIVEDK